MRAEKNPFEIHIGIIISLLVILIILLALIITHAAGVWPAEKAPQTDASLADGSLSDDNGSSLQLNGENGNQDMDLDQENTSGDSYEQIANYWEDSGVELVAYDGIVEHIFFHPCVAYPELAFDGDSQSNGIDDWMLTAGEYQKILESLYANDYILVDINTVYSEVDNGSGGTVMKRNTLYIPEGKKPLIISYDDVNYYDYMRENGFVYKLILDEQGNIAAWGLDPNGVEVVSYDLDVITMLDAFVAEHPDFSLHGAKGSIGLTGYEGILGYRTQSGSPNRDSEIEAVAPIVARLKETGWNFVSHSYGHINMTDSSYDRIVSDTTKWLDEVAPLIGGTTVLLYPYGARVDENNGQAFQYLQSVGFRYFISVGIESYINVHTDSPAVCGDRLHPDGITLRWYRGLYMKFYDAAEIIDLEVRPDRGYDFSL